MPSTLINSVDPAIGGSYMTLLNTFANLGGTWPASFIMYLIGQYTVPPTCTTGDDGVEVCTGGRDAYFPLQMLLSGLGCLWVLIMSKRVQYVADLPDDAWQTHIGEDKEEERELQSLGKGGKSK
jgi:PAT family acetyl-CoA transporter-like MFS transporter 1